MTSSAPAATRRALVTCETAGEHFALDVHVVERVLRYTPPRHVPNDAAWLQGVISVGKRMVPVLDLRERLGLPSATRGEGARILVLSMAQGAVGFVVDTVHEVLQVPPDAVREAPAVYRGLARAYVAGLVEARERLHLVLDAEALVSSSERLVMEAATAAATAEKTNG